MGLTQWTKSQNANRGKSGQRSRLGRALEVSSVGRMRTLGWRASGMLAAVNWVKMGKVVEQGHAAPHEEGSSS